jgi:tRNA A-37 threonylcarbamoyl transferase component Bud32
MGGWEVVGLPTTWIQTTNEPAELAELDMLRNDMETISFSRTEKWVGQIKQAIEHLHNQVVIWGDANTRNVMVDGETMRCWLTLGAG